MTALSESRKIAPLWKVIVSSSLLLTVAACSSSDDDDTDNAATDTTSFSIAADASREVPASGTQATAAGTLTLDDTTGELTGSVTASDIIVDAAHIHQGFAGSNGEVIIALEVDGVEISVPESTILTADQQASLLAGNLYLNIHSLEFPSGEIRDQLAPEGVSILQLSLAGSNEVPVNESTATGMAYLTVNDSTGATVINVITSGITTPEAAHIHGGFAGSNGDVLYPLVQDSAEVGNFNSSEGLVLSEDELASLQGGGTYINVHSAELPSGELRGQVLPEGVTLLSATLTGDQEVPPVVTSAAGSGVVTLDENNGTATAFVVVTDAPTATAGHIHDGDAGVNGDVIITLTQDTEDAGMFSASAELVTAAQIDSFKNEGMYFNVHTPANTDGEIRGQIEP